MTPITIASLNVAARNMMKLAHTQVPKTSKQFLSYSAVRSSYTESDYYSRHALHNQPAKAQVSNNAGGHVESSERTFVNNSANSHTSVSDVDETTFVPKVSSDDHVSGSGHNKV